MKNLILWVCVFFTASSWAQDPLLTDTFWYLFEVNFDGVNYSAPQNDPDFQPHLAFDTSSTPTRVFSSITIETFMADVSIDGSAFQFTTSNSTTTLFGCDDYCDLEAVYLFDFLYKTGDPVTFDYVISFIDGPEGASMALELFDEFDNYAFYFDTQLAVPDVQKQYVTVFPNPTSNVLLISTQNSEISNIRIMNAVGQQVYFSGYSKNSIDVSHLKGGMYFVEVITPEGRSVQKFIKK